MNKFLKIGTVVLVVVCLLVSSITVSAEGVPSFSFPLSQPSCGETFGYIEVLLQKSNGDLKPYVFLWSIYPEYASSEPVDVNYTLSVNVTSSEIKFNSDSNYIEHYGNLKMFYFSDDGSLNVLSSSDDAHNSFIFSIPLRSSIVGAHFYGNVEVDFFDGLSSGLDAAFNIVYSGQVDTNMLFTFLDSIYTNSGLTAEELSNIESLLDELLVSIYDQNVDILSVLELCKDYLSLLEDIDVSTSSTAYFLSNELYYYLQWFDSSLTHISDYVEDYLPLLEGLYDSTWDLLSLMKNYVSLQENLITQPPSSSSDLSDSIQNNPPREDGKDIVGDLDSAQNEALGGKTPEDVKEEIEDTLNSDKLKEELEEENEIEFEEIELEDITVVNQNVFNVVFDCFGGKWASYVVLSLSLAFACFVIGRRY